jgi:hypothetical protein
MYQPAYKPGSVGRGFNPPRDGHSSATSIARRLQRPTRTATIRTLIPRLGLLQGSSPAPSLFGLAPGGVCPAACVAAGAVRSYRTISPLPLPFLTLSASAGRDGLGKGGLFSVALSLGSRPPDVIRHRMSMEPGLSSRTGLSALVRAAARPTDARMHGDAGRERQELGHFSPKPVLGLRSGGSTRLDRA